MVSNILQLLSCELNETSSAKDNDITERTPSSTSPLVGRTQNNADAEKKVC